MKKVIIWGANHKITSTQFDELREDCDDLIFMDIDQIITDSTLGQDMKAIQKETVYLKLTARVINMLDAVQAKYKDYEIVLVQPAGNPKFHYELGKAMMSNLYEEDKTYTVLFAYSIRESTELVQADKSTKTVSIFKHVKFE